MTGLCLCGAVRVTIAAAPVFIHDCNCSLCRKRGAAWGYFAEAEVTTEGATVPYARADKPAGVEVHACAVCATTTHFALAPAFRAENPSADQAGVNMRLFDPDALDGVEVRFPDGKAWPGHGPFGYRREPMTIGDGVRW